MPVYRLCLALLAIGPLLALGGVSLARGAEPQVGLWRAWIDSPGGELPFGLEIAHDQAGWHVRLINGVERIDVPRVIWDGRTLVLDIDYYDSKITATPGANGTRLDGQWKKRGRGQSWVTMPFHAKVGRARRFQRITTKMGLPIEPTVDGRWSATFSGSDDPAVAIFQRQRDATISATFLTTTGDYRFLSGNLDNVRLRLSAFDGAHAFLFDARIQPDGTLEGGFWSGDSWYEAWTAHRDPEVTLPDAFDRAKWTTEVKLAELAFPDPDGKMRSLDDPEFRGRARIIEIFGTWCPNCNDATRYLVELDRRYRKRGLSIVALAFELSGDFKRDAAQVKIYSARHGIGYPVLIAGTSDKKEASAAVPMLDRVRAYPTTIFLDAQGQVRAVHTGFSGPATGEAHKQLREKFESLIEKLLDE